MTVTEAEVWFGNLNRVCTALQIASQNMTNWKRQGYIPWKLQFRIAMLTEGELMPDEVDPCIAYRPKKIRGKQDR